MRSLQEAIEGVYEAFGRIPRPLTMDGCPCCIDQKGISILLSKPLRELSPDDLTHYSASVFLTVGALYFLPRILDILATKPDWWPDPEVVNSRYSYCGLSFLAGISSACARPIL
jgi:hypothetical protein